MQLAKGDPADSRVVVNVDGTVTVTFPSDGSIPWDKPILIKVTAIDDTFVDGADTQVFAPGPHTLSGIQGPVVVDGAGGNGSLTGIAAPFLLPIGADGINPEKNVKPSTGNVVLLAGTALTVNTADLLLVVTTVDDLVNKTVEITEVLVGGFATQVPVLGQFRLITAAVDNGNGTTTLTLNEAFEPDAGEVITKYAITNESLNFFVDEKTQIDYMFVHDDDSPADSTGTLTSTRLYGLNMGPDLVYGGQVRPGGITYGSLEVLEINLGRGLNNFHVLGTPTRDDGFQTWTILNTGNDILDPIQPLVLGDTVTVKLNAIETVTAPAAVVAASNGDADNGVWASITLTGAAFADGELAGQLVRIASGFGNGQVRRVLNNVGNTATITTLWENIPDGTSTYEIINEVDGRLAVNLQGGDDTLNATGSTLGIVAFGGLGNDTMVGGDGDDILFGDKGRVDYFNEDGVIVTRLGRIRDAIIDTATAGSLANTLLDATANFETDHDGLKGLLVTIINGTGAPTPTMPAQRRFITENTSTTLTISEDWDVIPDVTSQYRISTVPEDQTDGITRDPTLLTTIDEANGGTDTINGGGGLDQIFGGAGGDIIDAGAGDDLVLGDAGRIDRLRDPAAPEEPVFGDAVHTLLDIIQTTFPAIGGADNIQGGADDDLLIGSTAGDTINGNAGDDLALGDFGQLTFTLGVLTQLDSTDLTLGGIDTVRGGSDQDLLVGGAFGDQIDGDAGHDLIFGDVVQLTWRGAVITDPRFQTLIATQIYATDPTNTTGGDRVDGVARNYRTPGGGAPSWAPWQIQNLYHTAALQAAPDNSFGNDYIAGGAGHDVMFGQLGNDTLQGDGSITYAGGAVGASRDGLNNLVLTASFEASTDGDDYIEGNGGNDVVFGGLGQDDIIGGSSDLYTLITPSLRPDGADLLFGGAGTRAGRFDDATGADFFAERHGRDADVMLGDNGNIYRLVGINHSDGGAFLVFNYDANGLAAEGYAATRRIIPRATRLLDYTPGGFDFNAAAAAGNIGAADELHGESGDDSLHGMLGNDVLFGDAQDDNIVGGYGADWISGGNGDDGILGDDGRLFASRNSTAFGEPLYGIAAIAAADINKLVATQSGDVSAITNVAGLLKYTADLTPQNLDPGAAQNVLFRPLFANDMIYGGTGTDSIHAGAGDDAVSGAEAPASAVTNNYNQNGVQLNTLSTIVSDFAHPFNPGNVLGYLPTGPNATKFALYDANDSLRKILLTATGALSKTGTGLEWILNFNHAEGPLDNRWIVGQTTYPAVATDGDDHIFAGLGHDWVVGGTGRDTAYGGWGDDLINVDDNLTTNNTLNTGTDTNPSFEDQAFGGAGRDVLIANTGGDRISDWLGEFNTYRVPWSNYGEPQVMRRILPKLPEYLYALSKSQGADQTLAAQYGGAAARNGEPFGELGLVVQQDAAWGAQNGGPRDPQAGNSNGKIDVKVSAGTQPLYQMAAGSPPVGSNANVITDSDLVPLVEAAKLLWTQTLGADNGRLAVLDDAQFLVGNLLPGNLGVTISNFVVIDSDAAEWGWFVDSTPTVAEEFQATGNSGQLFASPDSPASGRMDLLTVVIHEMGHLLGLPGWLDPAHSQTIMAESLGAGIRRLPTLADSRPNGSGQRNLLDLNHDGVIAAGDVLIIINSINARGGSYELSARVAASDGQVDQQQWLDVDQDGSVTASDVLKIINHLNAQYEPVDEYFEELSQPVAMASASDSSSELLALLVEDQLQAGPLRRGK